MMSGCCFREIFEVIEVEELTCTCFFLVDFYVWKYLFNWILL